MYNAFSGGVLAAAVGSATGEVPTLPSFCTGLCQRRLGDGGIRAEATVFAYAEVSAVVSPRVLRWGCGSGPSIVPVEYR